MHYAFAPTGGLSQMNARLAVSTLHSMPWKFVTHEAGHGQPYTPTQHPWDLRVALPPHPCTGAGFHAAVNPAQRDTTPRHATARHDEGRYLPVRFGALQLRTPFTLLISRRQLAGQR